MLSKITTQETRYFRAVASESAGRHSGVFPSSLATCCRYSCFAPAATQYRANVGALHSCHVQRHDRQPHFSRLSEVHLNRMDRELNESARNFIPSYFVPREQSWLTGQMPTTTTWPSSLASSYKHMPRTTALS